MKIQHIFLFVALSFFRISYAQTNEKWIPVLINHDGTNTMSGVMASYSIVKCNSVESVLLKLENTNNYSVKAQWINSIVTKDSKELYGTAGLLSVSLAPNSITTGDCIGSVAQLIVKLSDFGIQQNNFETIVGSNFLVIKK